MSGLAAYGFQGANMGASFTRSMYSGQGNARAFEVGGYNDDTTFADSIKREFNLEKTFKLLQRKAKALNNAAAIKAVDAHNDELNKQLKLLFPFFKKEVEGQWDAGLTGQEAVNNALDAISGMIRSTVNAVERSHPLSAIEAGLAKPQLTSN